MKQTAEIAVAKPKAADPTAPAKRLARKIRNAAADLNGLLDQAIRDGLVVEIRIGESAEVDGLVVIDSITASVGL